MSKDIPHLSGPLTVGLVCPYSLSAPGGVQNHVLGLAGYLTAIGDRVEILAPGDLDPQRARQYGVDPGQVTSAGGSVPVPYNGSVARVGFGPAVDYRVRRWLARVRPDLLHIHEPLAPGASLASLLAARTPVVATYHTATPRSALMRIAGRVLSPMIDKIEISVAVSEPARGVVTSHLDRDPAVIPNGFRLAEFDHAWPDRPEADHPGADHEIPSGRWRAGDHPRLVFLGRLQEPRKGLQVLLDALPMIKERRPDLEVVIAGSGSREWMAKIIRRSGGSVDRVITGDVDDATRTALLRSADVFVAPHLERESFGIVLIEAMAAGATVVASDLPAFTDLLGDDGGDPLGYVFRAGDPAGLARTVTWALDSDRTLLNLRARRAVRRYDWSVVGPRIRTLYSRATRTADPQQPAWDEIRRTGDHDIRRRRH